MACDNNCDKQTPKSGSNNINYIVIIVLYILLAIILGSVIF